MDYYNEWDPYPAQWLRNLQAAGHLPAGVVDERSIENVQPEELSGYRQVHFFAGIGGWPLALKLAEWPDDLPVWTGSCPCQPFSIAGKAGGVGDERHLWPAFYRLISECRPPVIFGEQVESKMGRAWLAGVRVDLEKLGYAVGAADLCAASVGAPHARQRLYWVADTEGARLSLQQRRGRIEKTLAGSEHDGSAGGLENPDKCGRRRSREEGVQRQIHKTKGSSVTLRGGNFWSDYDIILCRDRRARRTQPGIRPLAHGVPSRVGKLRAYGNAIVPQVAAEFVRAYMETSGLDL